MSDENRITFLFSLQKWYYKDVVIWRGD